MGEPRVNLARMTAVRRVVYLLVGAVVVLPYVFHLPLPFEPSRDAKELFGRINAIKSGGHVLLALDYDASSKAELNPMALALFRQCFRNGLIPIVMTHWNNGLVMHKEIVEQAVKDAKEELGREIESGRDYVFLGYRQGMSSVVLKMGEDLKATFKTDYYDKPTESMVALKGVGSLKDLDMGIDLAAGSTVEMWIVFGADRYHFALAAGSTAVQTPNLYPWLQSGQLVGLLGGLRGAADYEKLVKVSGEATRGMQAQSAVHVLLVALIVWGNLRLFFWGRRPPPGKGFRMSEPEEIQSPIRPAIELTVGICLLAAFLVVSLIIQKPFSEGKDHAIKSVGIILAAGLVLVIYSFLYRDNAAYKIVENLYVGVTLGYGVVITWRQALRPEVYEPFFAAPTMAALREAFIYRSIPILLGLLLLTRLSRKIGWMSRYSYALMIGWGAGLGIPLTIHTYIFKQLFAAVAPLLKVWNFAWTREWFNDVALPAAGALVVLVGTVAVLWYFFFSVEHKRAGRAFSQVGVCFLMISFGASFGYTVMARVSLLIERVQFLLFEWLKIPK